MSMLIAALRRVAHKAPFAVAVTDLERSISYSALLRSADTLALKLSGHGCRSTGICADNGIGWVVADLAAQISGTTLVPIPAWFHPSQVDHLIASSRIDSFIADRTAADLRLEDRDFARIDALDPALSLYQQTSTATWAATAPVMKITFTSGSTDHPKGVCLDVDMLSGVARRLAAAFAKLDIRRHLCVLPFSTLLENIAGIHVPLLLGATVVAPSLSRVGLYGSSSIDARRFATAVESSGAESLILLPELLRVLTAATASGRGNSLKFVAVGGARVADADLVTAHAAGIPAYQGYGLSECGSVVALNLPGASRAGSVGRPLPGTSVRIGDGGEILVAGQTMLGYLGEPGDPPALIASGDLGHLDDDGFLFVTGRRKHMFITSFGRNVAPEWPEAELAHEAAIGQVCVFGEAMPCNTAVIVPSGIGIGSGDIADAVRNANRKLPDYARIANWIIADEPFSVANGLLTGTGKPRRSAIALRYVNRMTAIGEADREFARTGSA